MTLNCIRDFLFFSLSLFFRKANRPKVWDTKNSTNEKTTLTSQQNLLTGHGNERQRQREDIQKCFFSPSASKGLGGTVGHAFSRTHADPALSSWTDNWTVLWRIWTLKGNLSHLIIGIQRMPFICINTNKTHSLPAQREPSLKRKSYYKNTHIPLKLN